MAPAAHERPQRLAAVARRDAADEIVDRLRLSAILTYEVANLSNRDLPSVNEHRLNLVVPRTFAAAARHLKAELGALP